MANDSVMRSRDIPSQIPLTMSNGLYLYRRGSFSNTASTKAVVRNPMRANQ